MTASIEKDSLQSSSFVFPPFFPIVRQECQEVASTFFKCIDTEAVIGDREKTSENLLRQCCKARDEYEACTRQSLSKLKNSPAAGGSPPPSVLVEFKEKKEKKERN